MYSIVINLVNYSLEDQVTDVVVVRHNTPNSRALIKPYLKTALQAMCLEFGDYNDAINAFIAGDTKSIKTNELNVFVQYFDSERVE